MIDFGMVCLEENYLCNKLVIMLNCMVHDGYVIELYNHFFFFLVQLQANISCVISQP
jgi:hypothetical protein